MRQKRIFQLMLVVLCIAGCGSSESVDATSEKDQENARFAIQKAFLAEELDKADIAIADRDFDSARVILTAELTRNCIPFAKGDKVSKGLEARWYFTLGLAHQRQGIDDQAIRCYDMLLALYSDSVYATTANYNRALIRFRSNEFRTSFEDIALDCSVVANADSGNELKSKALTLRSKCYLSLGKSDAAISDCNKALELDPNNSEAQELRSAL